MVVQGATEGSCDGLVWDDSITSQQGVAPIHYKNELRPTADWLDGFAPTRPRCTRCRGTRPTHSVNMHTRNEKQRQRTTRSPSDT